MESEISEARENLSKSMVELVSKIKNALADRPKIVGSNDVTSAQIFLQITDLTKRSAQTALKIKGCPAEDDSVSGHLKDLFSTLVTIQEKFRAHYNDQELVSSLEQASLRVHKSIKELAIVLKKFFEENASKIKEKPTSESYANLIPASKPPPPPTSPSLNLNSSDIEKDIFQSLSNETKAQVIRNSLDSGADTAHVRQLISLAKQKPQVVEVETESRATKRSSSEFNFDETLLRLQSVTKEVRGRNNMFLEKNADYWNVFRELSYCTEEITFGSSFAPIPDHPQSMVLVGRLGELNMQKADAVKKENFTRAQELKSLISDVEKQLLTIDEQNQNIRKNAKKSFYEEEKKLNAARKRELETKISELTATKNRAVEKEDFKVANTIKVELAHCEDELEEKRRYLAFIESLIM